MDKEEEKMENEKVFKKEGEFLIVTVTNEDKLILPNKQNDNGKEEIGTFEQTTIQKIGLASAVLTRIHL